MELTFIATPTSYSSILMLPDLICLPDTKQFKRERRVIRL